MQTEILLGSIQVDCPQPSLFELIMLENMEKLVKPAFRHILISISGHLDSASLFDQADNLSHAINAALEAKYLYYSPFSSTWIESLYGLARTASTPTKQLTLTQKTVSFAYVCIMPKLIAYLKALKERYRNELEGDQSSGNDWKRRLFRYSALALSGLGDLIAFADTTLVMIFRLLYVANLSPYHHPLFALLQMTLVKKRHLEKLASPNTTVASNTTNWTMSAIIMIIYAIKAAEFFTNNDLSEYYIASKLAPPTPVLPAPPPPKVARGGVIPPQDPTLCPLCLNKYIHPVASSSGYVYCYLCILEYVREKGTCPITAMPCKEADLIRIYED
eukprot:gene26213-31667_t